MEPSVNVIRLTNEVSMHDATLERVASDSFGMLLRLNFVAASPEVIGEGGLDDYLVLENVEIRCANGRTARLDCYDRESKIIQHPSPNHPISEIMNNEINGKLLIISGFDTESVDRRSSWVEWHIEADEFTLEWQTATRHSMPNVVTE